MKKFISLVLIACMSCVPAAEFEVRAGYAAEHDVEVEEVEDVEDEEFYELDDIDFSRLEQLGVSRADVEEFYHHRRSSHRPPRHGAPHPRPRRWPRRRHKSNIGKTAAGVVAGALIAVLIEEAIHNRDKNKSSKSESKAEREAEDEYEDEAEDEAESEREAEREVKREAEVKRGDLYADMLQACKSGSLAEFKSKFNEYELTGDAVINNNMALISIAAEHSPNANIIKFLLDEGADAGADGGRPLCAAAGNARVESVRLLLYAGADAAKTDERGRSALSYAAANYFDVSSRLEVIKALIIAGANFNLRDKAGMSPWAYAVQSGAPEVVNYLLDKGADARLSNIYNLAKANARLRGTQALKRIENANKRVRRKQ